MFKLVKGIFNTAKETLSIIVNIWTLIFFLGGSAMTATGATFLNKIPIIYPIILLVFGSLGIIFSMIRTIIKYRVWNNTKSNPMIDAIMGTELEYYKCLSRIADKVEKRNRKKNVDSKTRNQIVLEYTKMIGISNQEKMNQVLSSDFIASGQYTKREQKKFDKLFNLKPHDYHKRLTILLSFAHMLNTIGLGLKDEMGNTKECDEITTKLHQQQLQLEVSGNEIHIIDDLKNFTYGIFSMAVALRLVNRNRIWYKRIPLALINLKDNVNDDVKAKYDSFHIYVRKQLRKYVMKNGLLLE